jgi:hypothetical protein
MRCAQDFILGYFRADFPKLGFGPSLVFFVLYQGTTSAVP